MRRRPIPIRFLVRLRMSILPAGAALEKRCKELGVDLTVKSPGGVGGPMRASDFELQHRLMEAERSARENKLWMVAVVSAVASVVSALAAWAAVMVGK